MNNIRHAIIEDLVRIAEIEIFNYRLNFYPIFQNDWFYFNELKVPNKVKEYQGCISQFFVYDDGAIKGFMQIRKQELVKLFVEPVLQNKKIGSALLDYAIKELNVSSLWTLEKNTKAIKFYTRHGFKVSNNRKLEEGTNEYLVQLEVIQ